MRITKLFGPMLIEGKWYVKYSYMEGTVQQHRSEQFSNYDDAKLRKEILQKQLTNT
jgi:hypothetical protein